MTTTEHLQLIKAECERLLAIAEKRTQGEWYVSQYRTTVYARGNRSSQIAINEYHHQKTTRTATNASQR